MVHRKVPYLLAGVLLGAIALSGCSILGLGEGENWSSRDIEGIHFERLWKECQLALWNDPAGFKVEATDRDAGTLATYWRFFPYQFANDAWKKRSGLNHPYRLRAHVKVEPSGKDGYRVLVRVERERNTDEVDPSNETRASWSREADDRNKAEQILYRIENSVKLYRRDPLSVDD